MLAHSEKQVGTSVSQQVERVREVRYFDHLLTLFLERLGSNVVQLTAKNLRDQTDRAFRDGTIVTAAGPLFIDDFGGIGSSLSASPKYFEMLEKFSTVEPTVALEALAAVKPQGKDQRQQVEVEKQKRRAAIAATQAQVRGLRDTFTSLGAAVETFFGDAVECGVVLDGDYSALVRCLLDRSWLREPTASLIQRYGTRSAAHFTIIGTVTKASWIAPPRLTDEECAAAASLHVGTQPSEPTSIAPNSIRGAILAAQTVFEQLREMVMTVGSGDSVSVAPVVVFRNLDVHRSRASSEPDTT